MILSGIYRIGCASVVAAVSGELADASLRGIVNKYYRFDGDRQLHGVEEF